MEGILPLAVQHFQKKKDETSGVNNHTGWLHRGLNDLYLLEASTKDFDDVHGKMRHAAMYMNELSVYRDPDKYKLTLLLPKEEFWDMVADHAQTRFPWLAWENIARQLSCSAEDFPGEMDNVRTEQIMAACEYAYLKIAGTPYDRGNLLFFQIHQYLMRIWWGKVGAKARDLVVCHEGTMLYANYLTNQKVFPGWYRALIYDIHYHDLFTHQPTTYEELYRRYGQRA